MTDSIPRILIIISRTKATKEIKTNNSNLRIIIIILKIGDLINTITIIITIIIIMIIEMILEIRLPFQYNK